MQKCLKPAFSLTARRGRPHRFQVQLYVSLWGNVLISPNSMYDFWRQFLQEWLQSLSSSSIHHDVHFLNCDPTVSKMDHIHMAVLFLWHHTQGVELKFWSDVLLLCPAYKIFINVGDLTEFSHSLVDRSATENNTFSLMLSKVSIQPLPS